LFNLCIFITLKQNYNFEDKISLVDQYVSSSTVICRVNSLETIFIFLC